MTPTSTSSSNSEDCSKTSSPTGQVSGVRFLIIIIIIIVIILIIIFISLLNFIYYYLCLDSNVFCQIWIKRIKYITSGPICDVAQEFVFE